MKSKFLTLFTLLMFMLFAVACKSSATEEPSATEAPAATEATSEEPTEAPASDGPISLTMWYHGAGNEVERKIILQIIDEFNASQSDYKVEIQDFPQESYNESIVAAALAGDLPDIIDVDGPVMPNWAWAGYMQPLDLPAGTVDNYLPGALGYWDGELYSVGLWDAAIAMFARKSVLEANNIRIPTLDQPWTLEEFDAALVTLQGTGEFEYALDLGTAWTGEWYPYAFSPFLQSFGGDIIDRSTYTTAEGALNGPEALAFGEWWQSLFERGLAPGTSQDGADRDTGFIDGKYALQWNGNWAALGALDAFGDDLLFLPAPNFGNGSRIGAASWQFGVSANSANPAGANAFIAFALQDKYLAAFSNGIGLIPSTPSAAAMTKNYAPGGPLEVFFELSNRQGTLRPPTPAYLSAALTFEKALADIANGADVATTLDTATDEINADIEANGGYGFDGSEVGPNIQNDAIATGSTSSSTDTGETATTTEATVLTMWYHGAGNEVERTILTGIIDDFNASQSEYKVEMQDFPQESYNESIVAAALAGDLPDIIDVDGPVMPNWAWAGYMQPLQLSDGALDDFLPGTIGTWDGEVYSVGLWDAAVVMFARKSVLEANGIRIPTLDQPWTLEEFDAALVTLQGTGEFEYALDLGTAWTGEWYPYAFSPFLQSFGGDIIDRSTYLTAEGALNGDSAIAFGEWWQSLFERGLAPGTSQDGADRDTGFIDGKYALQWNGNWAALAALDAFGDDLLFLPAPDFGNGPKIGAASWQFGVSANSTHPEGANAFIEFAIQDKYLAAFSDGIGLIPSTPSAAAMTKNYAPGGPLEIFFQLSNVQALIRPPTPAYLSAALTFEKALADIANGADVITT
ncbi:MAG TPA: extracellular solute-binding protein, partial [Anaerolineales bacterium]|nr:extracellular solute-binding protein [Anaerolineales bacterium]